MPTQHARHGRRRDASEVSSHHRDNSHKHEKNGRLVNELHPYLEVERERSP